MCECGPKDDAPGPVRRPARVDQQQEAGHHTAGHPHRPRGGGGGGGGRRRRMGGTCCWRGARRVLCLNVLVLLVLLCAGCVAAAAHRTHRATDPHDHHASSIVAQFWTANQSLQLQHLVYNRNAGVLYVGGTNRLWALGTGRLNLEARVETGPRFDSPWCHASGCGLENRVKRVLTDNVNKVLVLDPDGSTLIMCGSVSQGACEKFRTANLSLTPEFIPRSVAANDPDSSTFAFVGPEHYNQWGGSAALYVGTTFTTVGDYRHDVPAVSTRNLYDLDYAEFSFSKQSLLRIDVKYRDHFLVQYVYGFNASGYAYFVTMQKRSHLPGQEESGYISRLARTCITDANYDSYTEITLECLGADGTYYNLVQDAKLVRAGSDLASSMGVGVGDPVLIGAFAPSQGHTSNPESASAVCVYSVHDIESKFNENIHMCFNGSMQYRSMEYISGPILNGKCPAAGTMGNIYNFCEVGLKISGVSPLQARAALVYRNTSLSAVQAATTAHHTVLFMGTTTGTLKKALLAGPEDAAEYGEDTIDAGSRVLPDMVLDNAGAHIFVLTTTRVTKYRVEGCSTYTNCSSCLGARDPYCGWCSLEKRCTVQSACQKATFSSPRWLSFGSGQQCIDFEMILPDRLPVDQMATVQLTIRTLPELPAGAKYQCVWGSAPPADALVTASGLTCITPARANRPAIPVHHDHVLVPLAVRSSETNKDFVSRNFAFYDCGRHNTCGSCVRSNWACNWCVYENTCTHNASSCSGNVVSGENVSILQLLRENPAQLASHGSGFCPRFWADESQLLAADGARSELQLLVENLPVPRVGQLGFQCVVSIEGATMLVGARVMGAAAEDDDSSLSPTTTSTTVTHHHHQQQQQHRRVQRVVCEPTVYRYQSDEGEYEARVTLVWNRDHVVDARPLTLYKCGVLGAHRGHHDCSLCVTRHPRYHCTWCGAACRYAPHCPTAAAGVAAASSSAVVPRTSSRDQPDATANEARLSQCPTPRIDVIQPLAGPLEGGTLVTIEGSNLGLREEDVQENVYIGNVPCHVHEYFVSVKITCRTSPAPLGHGGPSSTDLQFPVVVTTPAGTTQSTVKFTYTNVSVTGVWPTHGPASGGTVLSISGRFLNVGSHVSAKLDDLPCAVNKTQSSSHRLVCVTSRAPVSGDDSKEGDSLPWTVRTLTVTVDGARRTLASPFTYSPDPKVLELKPLRSPWGGGRLVTVHGTHLDAIQAPRITVNLFERVLNSSACRVLSSDQMECPSPPLDRDAVLAILEAHDSVRRRRRSRNRRSHKAQRSPRRRDHDGDEVAVDVGFVMDGVASVLHLRKHFPNVRSRLTYLPDPQYYAFPHGVKLYKGDTLVIEGEHINDAADESDVRVTIGASVCNVTSLAGTQLVCTPPEVQPDPTDERGVATPERLPLVVVHVGQYLRYPLGVLRYERNRRFPLTPEGIAGLAGGALFLVLASFVVLAVYRRKSSQAERVYKLMQLQMDSLESHVRTECKQAFAELQTDMTDLTADLESSGIPTLDHRTYVMKVFFPGVTDHPILSDPKARAHGPRTNYDVAMLQFEQLIANKHFLLSFIDTLESQKSFNIRDKVNVASLVTVLQMGRMEYLTEVMRCLMLRLVSSAAATKHPQLMLRRTESVVEKMLTNWMALCMYTYLRGDAGTALFLLYKAIKHQVEKGPVDALTHDARYSLSEERLLREQVDFSPVTLTMYAEEYEEKVQVKVLDCDTISQVKAKILDALYRNTPQSLRPSVHEVDLEWRHGRAGRVTLSDEDRTTVTGVGGWRGVNTLAHYGVRDSAVMALIPRQNDSFSSNCTGYYSYANSVSPLNSPGGEAGGDCGTNAAGRGSSTTNAGVRLYHLVRTADDSASGSLVSRDGRDRTYGTHKAIPEIFLTRLLSTKGTVQQFVDDFFRTILSANDGLPPAVKWLFDLLDDAARAHGITDPEVIHAWKSNCLPLRFWVNFIKNPDFIFDIGKTPTVDSCLSVIAQTFIDACSTTEHRLGKDSPSNKLLFAKDIPRYRAQVKNFYSDVATAQPVSEQELGQHMQQLSSAHQGHFDNLAALKELYIYVTKYHELILESLDADPYCRKLNLAHRLQSIGYILESYSHGGPVAPMPPLQLAGQLSEL